jgi:hypothetical protein
MIETNNSSEHLAAIIPIAGESLNLNMPWHDSLMPIHENYHAIERAVHTAAVAGCNTIWIVMHRESQPIIRKKLGSWIYDPETVWKNPYPHLQVREIPIYYVAINAKDRNRRDSLAWSCLYGAKVASYTSKKISKWLLPKRFLVIPPYGVVPEDEIKNSRDILRGSQNIVFTNSDKSFKDNEFLPFTFSQKEYEECRIYFRDRYSGDETMRTFKDIFKPVSLENYTNIKLNWYYNISDWSGYTNFITSQHNKLCTRPKYMVGRDWWGLVKDK